MKILHTNKKARFEYFVEESFEAGIILKGTEVKSCILGQIDLSDGYVDVKDNRVILKQVYIAKYSKKGYSDHEEKADRYLLLHISEIRKLEKYIKIRGYTVIPLSLYISKNKKIKIEIGICKGKKLHDKRETLKKKQIDMDSRRD